MIQIKKMKGYYSLLLLFVPFRNESDLINTSQAAEGAFSLFIESNSNIEEHHEKLTKFCKPKKRCAKLMNIVNLLKENP